MDYQGEEVEYEIIESIPIVGDDIDPNTHPTISISQDVKSYGSVIDLLRALSIGGGYDI
jgi:hypothetical protein